MSGLKKSHSPTFQKKFELHVGIDGTGAGPNCQERDIACRIGWNWDTSGFQQKWNCTSGLMEIGQVRNSKKDKLHVGFDEIGKRLNCIKREMWIGTHQDCGKSEIACRVRWNLSRSRVHKKWNCMSSQKVELFVGWVDIDMWGLPKKVRFHADLMELGHVWIAKWWTCKSDLIELGHVRIPQNDKSHVGFDGNWPRAHPDFTKQGDVYMV